MSDQYDLIIVGGGPGGLAAAEMGAAKGKKVLIIEKDGWGGTCTHRGCIPTKALLSCSKFYTELRKLKRAGINMGNVVVDFTAMKKHRDQTVKVAALGAQKLLADAKVEMKTGTGDILSPRDVQFADAEGRRQSLTTNHILIAWGSVPQLLNDVSPSERILTSDEILNINALPSSMIIVGGSFIGVEYAILFAELGVKVILVEQLDRILPQEDDEAADLLGQELARLGVALHTSTALITLKESSGGVVMHVRKNGETTEMRAGYALLCMGRKPLLHREQLDRLGIHYDHAGIKVGPNMMTSMASIYAAGDVTGGMMLAHRAALQAKVAVENLFGGNDYVYNEDFIPSVVYSHPQIARVGCTQKRAHDKGLNVDVVKSTYGANIMARAELMGQGFLKAVFHQDQMIGAVIVGDHAADLIAPLSLAVSSRLTRKQLRSWIIPHPTLSEIFLPLLE